MVTLAVPGQGTCSPWATASDVCDPCNDYTIDAILLDNALQAASDILYALSGRQWAGVCQDTVRPCARSLAMDHGRPFRMGIPFGAVGFYPGPYYAGGGGFSPWGWCTCNRTERAGCHTTPEITLGGYPVTSIVQVKQDGVVLDPSTYQVDDHRYLIRMADPATQQNPGWPCCQRMDLDTDQPDTWEVTYTYGVPPPMAGVTAAAYLGCQLALMCNPDTIDRCQLPQRVTNINRQGVSMVVLDPMQFIDKGRTGIYLIDLFLEAANPGRLTRPSVVMSPDIGRRVRRSHTDGH